MLRPVGAWQTIGEEIGQATITCPLKCHIKFNKEKGET